MNNAYLQNGTVSAGSIRESMERGNGPRPEPMQSGRNETEISVKWVLDKMEAIINDNAYISEAIMAITDMKPTGEHDHSTRAKADSISSIVKSRESTNQQTLMFLQKIYDDLTPGSHNSESMLKNLDLVGLAEAMDSEAVVQIVRAVTGRD